MKKIKMPFSLSEYQKGGYEVETRSDKKVRIAMTDLRGTQPILAVMESSKNTDSDFRFTINGKYYASTPSDYDLFLVKYEFEDGDIVYSDNDYTSMISIFKGFRNDSKSTINIYVDVYTCRGERWLKFNNWCDARNIRPATNEETLSLYNALATQKGLKWNAEIKDFEKIGDESTEKVVEIKKGDKFLCVKDFTSNNKLIEYFTKGKVYLSKVDGFISDNGDVCHSFAYSSEELTEYFEPYNKEDTTIGTTNGKKDMIFKTWDKVLVRDHIDAEWEPDFYGYFSEEEELPYRCIGKYSKFCIPYNDETKYLAGTNKECPDKYK